MKLQAGEHTFYEFIRLLGERMHDASEQCLQAAAHHVDPEVQKALLAASSMGMALGELCSSVDIIHYAEHCESKTLQSATPTVRLTSWRPLASSA